MLPLIVVLLACLAAHAQVVDLPGVDVLQSGFDGASWLSVTKFSIFDLSDPGPAVFVPETNRSFTPPKMASVATDGPASRRVEDSCVTVTSLFTEFLHVYQESVSLDVGFQSGNFSLGLHAHHDLNETYHAITERLQAVGLSTSWWGMYTVSLPPAFLLTGSLHPVFQQARAALDRVGVPQNDAQQTMYNQVVESFGSHYVSSVIVGARATMYTYVNNSFHSEFSESTTHNQVSIGFEYSKFKLSGDARSDDYKKQIMEAFSNNTQSHVEFQPDIPASADTPWLVWEDAAQRRPVVVNMTAALLSDLFLDMPPVQEHMRSTIMFYLAQGRLPTLADLAPPAASPALAPALLAPPHSPQPLPGLGVVGCGFDVTRLTSTFCIFDSSQPGDTWANPLHPDIAYTVPEGFFVVDTPESLMLNGTLLFNSLSDWATHSWWQEKHSDSGFLGFGAKKETKTTDEKFRNFYAHRYSLALSVRQIAWFTVSMSEFPQPRMHPIFLEALTFLPDTYDPANTTQTDMFQQFFQTFGTHVAVAADMGGAVWAEDWFESCLVHKYSDVCVTDEIEKKYDPIGIVHKSDHSNHCDKSITKDYRDYSTSHFELLGGTDKIPVEDWEEWAATVPYSPKPVRMQLVPLHYLLLDHSKGSVLAQATQAFLHGAEADRQRTIDELERTRPPPPSMCSATPTALARADEDPRAVLCPIVGYDGQFCPGAAPPLLHAMDAAPTRPLPKGVGLTLDVSTGELKLPVIDFSQASQATWLDAASNTTYAIPVGVALDANVAAFNTPAVRVFKTEEELADVWENGYKEGTWLGGQFGRSQSLHDVYNNFFSKSQATAISQHPTAVYKLTLEQGWEKRLNPFVQSALKALPEQYDEHIYRLFMDTWGTHVATQTLVGGMAEMQVAMKACMWGSAYLTDGLSDEQLRDLLSLDLTKAPIQDNYYIARRKISIDHRLGGDPGEGDMAAWKSSIPSNPALLQIFAHTPWDVVANSSGLVLPAVIANLKTAVQTLLTAAEAQRQADRQAVEQARAAELLAPRPVIAVVGHGRRGGIAPQIQIGGVIQMKGFSDCPPGLSDQEANSRCSTGVNIESWNRVHMVQPLRYERNDKGDMRSSRCFDLDGSMRCIDHFGPWVRIGCSEQPFANGSPRDFHAPVPDSTVVGLVCADCQPMATNFGNDATIKCACPGYTAMELGLRGDASQELPEGRLVSVEDKPQGPLDVPDFKQCDKRWGCFPYAGHTGKSTCNETACNGTASMNNICVSGCGITCTAMVLSYFQKVFGNPHPTVYPTDVAQFLVAEGFRDDLTGPDGATCNGVSHTAMCAMAAAYGVDCTPSDSVGDAYAMLAQGPVVAHVRHRTGTSPDSCKFTHAGHYVVLTGVASPGNFTLHDPNSTVPTHTWGTVTELVDECAFVGLVGFAKREPRAISMVD